MLDGIDFKIPQIPETVEKLGLSIQFKFNISDLRLPLNLKELHIY